MKSLLVFSISFVLVYLGSAQQAFAAMSMTPLRPPACNCRKDGLQDFRDLIVKASVTKEDDGFGNMDGRGSLSERQALLGLSDAEADKIRKSTGYIKCKISEGVFSIGSASLVGSNQQILTAAHAFFDKKTGAPYDLSKCYFQNQEGTPQKIAVDTSAEGRILGMAPKPMGPIEENDYAVIRLKEPVQGAEPFELATEPMSKGQWIIGVSALQKSPYQEFTKGEPVVQRCKVREAVLGQHSRYYTDCDSSGGASGGAILVRNTSGELAIGGTHVASGILDEQNGTSYSLESGNASHVIGSDGSVNEAIIKLKGTTPSRTTEVSI